MIIWINGAFGSGKTQTAYELHRRLDASYVYDPENAGCFIRENLPSALGKDDFQDYPMWRAFNLEMLEYIAENFQGDIIVPMTVTNRAYYDEIIGALSRKYDVRHIILCASEATIRRRLRSRFEGKRSWAVGQIDRCLRAFDTEIVGEKIITDDLSVEQTVEIIGKLTEKELSVDRRGAIRRAIDRFATRLRHIR